MCEAVPNLARAVSMRFVIAVLILVPLLGCDAQEAVVQPEAEEFLCTVDADCIHGVCKEDGSCRCIQGWYGDDCSAETPPLTYENGVMASIMCIGALALLVGYFYMAVFSKEAKEAKAGE